MQQLLLFAKRLRPWVILTSKFLAGQSLIQAVNVASGLLIIWLLPISEFALYTVASMLLVIGAIGSDFGLSQAVNTIGARIKDDKELLGSLYASAYNYRRLLYPAAVVVIVIISIYMIYGQVWSPKSAGYIVGLVLLTSWVQQPISLMKSILNVRHDSRGLLEAGLAEGLARLLAIALCVLWPTAVSALTVNLIGIALGRYFLSKRCKSFIAQNVPSNQRQSDALKKFVLPLVPVVIYYLLQGNISIFLLGLCGMTHAIAEVAALGRLGQIVGLLLMLNSFIIQPYFARIEQRQIFVRRILLLLFFFLVLILVGMVSVCWLPHWWLFVLGKQYSGLVRELPWAMMGALLSVFGATMYTIVIARNRTAGQSWYIFFGITSQAFFIVAFGVRTTFDALILNILPTVVYIFVQAIFVIMIIKDWEVDVARQNSTS